MPTLLAKNAIVLVTMDAERRELKECRCYTVINGRVIVESGAVVTVDMGPVIEAHHYFSLSIA